MILSIKYVKCQKLHLMTKFPKFNIIKQFNEHLLITITILELIYNICIQFC